MLIFFARRFFVSPSSTIAIVAQFSLAPALTKQLAANATMKFSRSILDFWVDVAMPIIAPCCLNNQFNPHPSFIPFFSELVGRLPESKITQIKALSESSFVFCNL